MAYNLLAAGKRALAGNNTNLARPLMEAPDGQYKIKMDSVTFWETVFSLQYAFEPECLFSRPKVRASSDFFRACPGIIINILLITFKVTKTAG